MLNAKWTMSEEIDVYLLGDEVKYMYIMCFDGKLKSLKRNDSSLQIRQRRDGRD